MKTYYIIFLGHIATTIETNDPQIATDLYKASAASLGTETTELVEVLVPCQS